MFEEFEKLENADLKNFSTMRVGGVAKIVIFPKNHLEIVKILKICKDNGLRFFIVGNGSNVLFDDAGFDGVLISIKHFNKLKKIGDCVQVGAGCNLFVLNQKLADIGLSGLEWCYGIPATLGGLLYMNGGCFGHEIGQFVQEVLVMDGQKVRRLKKDELQFSYRRSNLQKYVILGAKLRLKHEKSAKIRENMQFFFNKKRESQPCEYPSLGSIFKRSENLIPAKLIDEMGLKGTSIGGAQVSTKHAGFIVNTGGATATDVLQLIKLIEDKFNEKNIRLEKEIVVIKNA